MVNPPDSGIVWNISLHCAPGNRFLDRYLVP
jgi:hypothetical protein